MSQKLQRTRLHIAFGAGLERLENWSVNPWRRSSLLLIAFLAAFVLGSSIGMINGVLAVMDPVGALITVLLLELMIRLRRGWPSSKRDAITRQLLDFIRIGILYGLLHEGFKLL